MALKTTFLDKKFEFSDDLIKYLNILELTVSAHSELYDYFVKKVANKTIYIDDITPELRRQAEKYIVLLCENGVYTRTVEECINQSQGYTLVSSTIDLAVEKMINILSDEIDEYSRGLDMAQAEAESKVTGSGVSVWSSSFTTLATYAAVDYLTAKGQIKKAQSEFQTQISKVEADAHNRSEQRKAQYIKDTYLPNMFNALGIFVFSMMDNCLSDMSEVGSFDSSVLKYVNMKKSGELLKNLSLSNNAESVLMAAYEVCPFNMQIYIECATRGWFSKDMLSFLSRIGKKEAFEAEIKKLYAKFLSKARECGSDDFISLLQDTKIITEVLSLISNKPTGYYYKDLGKTVYLSIVSQYDNLKNYIQNDALRYKWYKKFADDDIIAMTAEQVKDIVRAEVYNISTDDVFSALIDICEYSALLTEISHHDMPKAEISKSNIDEYYAEYCAELISNCLQNVKQSIKERKAAQEKIATKNKKIKEVGERKKKHFKSFIILFLAVIYVIPITIHLIQVASYESAVQEEISAIITKNLRKELADVNSYASEIELQNRFTINSIEFYKSKHSGDIYHIVPNVTFYSTTSGTWKVTGRLAVGDIIDGDSNIDAPVGVSARHPFINGNAIIIEADGNKLEALWFDNYNDNGLYEKANIYVSGSLIMWYILFAIALFTAYKLVVIQISKKIDEKTLKLCAEAIPNIIISDISS